MSNRKYFCPLDYTEVDEETAETGSCPNDGYGPGRNAHERDWLTAGQLQELPATGDGETVQPATEVVGLSTPTTDAVGSATAAPLAAGEASTTRKKASTADGAE